MRIKHALLLFCVIILSIVLVLIINFCPDNISRYIIGLPFMLLCPGYALIYVLFPGKDRFYGSEKLFLSFGLSLAVVPLICLILNFTSGLTLNFALYSLTGFVIVFSIIAFIRQFGLPDNEKDCLIISFSWFRGKSIAEIFLFFVIALVACGTISVLVYVIAVPKTGSAYTEFYILNSQGIANDYPSDIKTGDTESVIPVVINHENRQVEYRIEILIDNDPNDDIEPLILNIIDEINLDNEERYETPASFTPQTTGDEQKLYFVLYKEGETESYLELNLTINVN